MARVAPCKQPPQASTRTSRCPPALQSQRLICLFFNRRVLSPLAIVPHPHFAFLSPSRPLSLCTRHRPCPSPIKRGLSTLVAFSPGPLTCLPARPKSDDRSASRLGASQLGTTPPPGEGTPVPRCFAGRCEAALVSTLTTALGADYTRFPRPSSPRLVHRRLCESQASSVPAAATSTTQRL